jgi:hypothetical protein
MTVGIQGHSDFRRGDRVEPDSLPLALGNRIPVFVAVKVVTQQDPWSIGAVCRVCNLLVCYPKKVLAYDLRSRPLGSYLDSAHCRRELLELQYPKGEKKYSKFDRLMIRWNMQVSRR